MSAEAKEYKSLLQFYSSNTSAGNIVSLAMAPNNYADLNVTNVVGNYNNSAVLDYAVLTSLNMPNGSGVGANNLSSAVPMTTPRISAELPIWLIPCYSVILLFAIVGNLLVISTLAQNRRMRTITNLFLLNLAISDILLGVLCMPVTLVGTLLRHFIFGAFLCKLIPFLQAISVAVSSWTLVAISCERYYAICHPLRSRTWQTINHAYKIIGFIWLGSIICMTPIAVFSQLRPTSRQGLRKCREHWPINSLGYERSYNILLDLILLVLPLIILCVAYILITRTLYVGMKNERAIIFGNNSNKVSTQVEAVATVTTTLMPSSSFNFHMSFRCHTARNHAGNKRSHSSKSSKCRRAHADNQQDNDAACQQKQQQNIQPQQQQQQPQTRRNKTSQKRAQEEQMQKQQQQKQQQHQQRYDDVAQSGSKWKLLTATDGHRQLYRMRSASVKSLNRHCSNNNSCSSNSGNNSADVDVSSCGAGASAGGSNTGTSAGSRGFPSPSPSMTVINVPHQQRFKLHQQRQSQSMERRKSISTPSLRIKDAALRRSNEAKNLESKKRVVKMMFVLVLEFFICWSPLYVINTLAMFIGPALYEYINYTSISFLQLLAYSSSCCNPITYCFMNASFRRAFLDTFKGLQLNSKRLRGKRPNTATNLSVAGNSITLANSITVMSNNTMLESPRL